MTKRSKKHSDQRSVRMERDAVCPFFRYGTPRSVCCEGYCDGCNVESRFGSKKQTAMHFDTYCAGNYKMCEVHNMVMQAKYDEE